MHLYRLNETITRRTPEEFFGEDEKAGQYVAVLSPEEWIATRDRFGMDIELEPYGAEIISTKAEVNYDALTGSFLIPDRSALGEKDYRFSFALDEKGIVFIDPGKKAAAMTEEIAKNKH